MYHEPLSVAMAMPTTSPLPVGQPGPLVFKSGSRVSRSTAIVLACVRSGSSFGAVHSASGANMGNWSLVSLFIASFRRQGHVTGNVHPAIEVLGALHQPR